MKNIFFNYFYYGEFLRFLVLLMETIIYNSGSQLFLFYVQFQKFHSPFKLEFI